MPSLSWPRSSPRSTRHPPYTVHFSSLLSRDSSPDVPANHCPGGSRARHENPRLNPLQRQHRCPDVTSVALTGAVIRRQHHGPAAPPSRIRAARPGRGARRDGGVQRVAGRSRLAPGRGDAELRGACAGLRGGLRHRGAGPDGKRICMPRREPKPRALGWTTTGSSWWRSASNRCCSPASFTSDPGRPFSDRPPPPPIGILLAALSMPAAVAADTIRGQLTARPSDTQPVPTCAWAVDIR